MAAAEPNALTVRDFSKVILTLDNVLIPEDKLSPTPSMIDGLEWEYELDLRIQGCELMQTTGNLLKLPQVFLPNLLTCIPLLCESTDNLNLARICRELEK